MFLELQCILLILEGNKPGAACSHFPPMRCSRIEKLSHGDIIWSLTVKVLVTQSCPTLCVPIDCYLPGSSVLGILQARLLEWVATPFSRWIFLNPRSNLGLPHCRQILYCLRHQGHHDLIMRDKTRASLYLELWSCQTAWNPSQKGHLMLTQKSKTVSSVKKWQFIKTHWGSKHWEWRIS